MRTGRLDLQIEISREAKASLVVEGCVYEGPSQGFQGKSVLEAESDSLPLSLSVPASPLARLSTAMARNTFNRMSGVSSG